MTAYLTPLLTFVGSLVSIAVLWGMLRATVDSLKGEVGRLRDANGKHEENLSAFREEFTNLREEVRVAFASQQVGKMAASRSRKRR